MTLLRVKGGGRGGGAARCAGCSVPLPAERLRRGGLDESWLVVLPQGSAPSDADGEGVRPAENLRPLLLKSAEQECRGLARARDAPHLAAPGAPVAAWLRVGPRPRSQHGRPRHVCQGSALDRPVVDLPVLWPCGMATDFPTFSRRWLRRVLECLGMPMAANAGNFLMLNLGGLLTVAFVTSGIVQG